MSSQLSPEDSAGAAEVRAHWVLPDGTSQAAVDVTSLNGFAHFQLNGSARGIYTLVIDDVDLDGHEFDADGSVLEASIRAR